jgi:hypothetical protein
MPRIIAMSITEKTLPLIIVLMGGARPSQLAVKYQDYFILELAEDNTVQKYDVVHEEEFHMLQTLNFDITMFATQ